MQEYEIEPLVKNLELKSKQDWEQSRMVGYIIAQGNSTKKLKPSDIIKFSWDDKQEMFTGVKEISNEDVDRLKNKSQNFITNGK